MTDEKKPAIERLENFCPYKDFQERRDIAEEFFKDLTDTVINKIFDGPLESAIALLITFMEWQENRKKSDD